MARVNVRFTRASAEVPDGLGLGGDREVFQYDLDIPDPVLLVAECHHDSACGTSVVQGRRLPSRPCPILPLADAAQWMCTGLHACGWRGNNPDKAVSTSGMYMCPKCKRRAAVSTADHVRFAPMQVDACVDCPHASIPVIGLETDRSRIVDAFAEALNIDVDLTAEDRALHRWEILWGQTTVG